jgi:hypothetical protein
MKVSIMLLVDKNKIVLLRILSVIISENRMLEIYRSSTFREWTTVAIPER